MATQYVPILNPQYSGNRSSSRARLGIAARLETLSGTFPCMVRDISTGGAHVMGPALKRAQCLVLLIEGHEIFAEVAWTGEKGAGLVFRPGIEQDLVVWLRRQVPEIIGRESRATEAFARRWVAGLTGEF